LLETDPKASTAAGRRNNTVINSSELFENQYIYNDSFLNPKFDNIERSGEILNAPTIGQPLDSPR
jgi:hypothetical protein